MNKTTKRLLLLAFVLLFAGQAVDAAIVTRDFATFGGGQVVVTFDHNEGNGNVLHFDCVNVSDYDAWLGVYRMDYSQTPPTETLMGEDICPAHGSFSTPVPGLSVQWICELLDPEHPEWGEDCGLDMADLQFRARWPN